MGDIDFAELIVRVKAGDEEAIARLIEQFGPEVRIMVRSRLPDKLRGQFDTMDFAQVVWNSVVVNCRERAEPFDEPKHLIGFLIGVVKNKVAQEHRRLTRTRKYDVGREEPLYVRRGDREVPREVSAPDPTPSEYAQADDRLDQLTRGRTPQEIRVVDLRLAGLTFDEIAVELGIHEKAVRRVIESIRERMEARQWR